MNDHPGAQREFRTAQDDSYRYRNVRQDYRTEEMRIAAHERARIEDWLSRDVPQTPNAGQAPGSRLIIDTDVGTDVDDALALLFALQVAGAQAELLGITTVYGHSHLRAAIARAIVEAGTADSVEWRALPVTAGESTPLGTHFPVWHTGTEGERVLDREHIEALQRKSDFAVANGIAPAPIVDVHTSRRHGRHAAACWIIEQIRRYPGEVTIASIGALTNIAVALRLDPAIKSLVRRVVHMGTGSGLTSAPEAMAAQRFAPRGAPIEAGTRRAWVHYPNINLIADTLGATEVFGAGIPVDVIGHDVTSQLWWGAASSRRHAAHQLECAVEACAALRRARAPAPAAVVGRMLDVWLDYRTAIFGRAMQGTCPHDPLTVAEAMFPGRFVTFSPPGHLLVHEWAAFSSFVCCPGGPHRIASAVERNPFIELLSAALRPVA
jgi:inosine-uridine nucleoside N-ribohydrolase